MAYIVPQWELKLFSATELLQLNGTIGGKPCIESPAMRLARSGFEIMRNAEDQRARGDLEIADAFRRRR